MSTKVYKITLLVIDLEDMGEEQTREALENARYLYASVLDTQTAEVEWHDAHPLNQSTETRAQAVAGLFDDLYAKGLRDAAAKVRELAEHAGTDRGFLDQLAEDILRGN